MSKRLYFGNIKEVIEPPNLIEIQLQSYFDFLQQDTPAAARKNIGLQGVLKEIFPIKSYDENIELDFLSYEIEQPKMSDYEAIRAGETYSAALQVTFKLKSDNESKEETVYMGEMPMMTNRGTFVINGAERVIVSQLHRSPGICFESAQHLNGKLLHSFRIIPDRGSWLEVQFDTNDLLYVYLDRRRRRRKFLATTFMRYLGFKTDRDIVSQFYDIRTLPLSEDMTEEDLHNLVAVDTIKDKDLVLAKAFEQLNMGVVRQLLQFGIKEIDVINQNEDDVLIKTLKKDPAHDEESALKEIYKRLRPGDPATAAQARTLLKRLFDDPKKYDLTRVGRYKINQKLGLDTSLDQRLMTAEDFLAALKYLLRLKKGEGMVDDIDHLGSRRVRAVGELMANQCRVGLARTERLVKERMTLIDQNIEGVTPSKLINPKALSAVVRDFFGRSQLSQFMDQINPLAELTHKRRLSALGPGGLNRDRAGFEVRDVHPSHYGRICPIETPEGPNIGLINSMCTYARINEFGFIETPYRKVENGRVTNTIEYVTADQEEGYLIAQANNPLDEQGNFTTSRVTAREKGEFIEVDPADVHYMDVSPKQLVSIAAGLIPFLEHDDANRALMGSNMQRQGVPLMVAESPYVGTGIEGKCARDSRSVVLAEADGIVASASAEVIITTKDGELPVRPEVYLSDPDSVRTDRDNGIYVYPLRKFMRSNAGTCINQRPIVRRGDKIKAGDVLADGPNTDQGELALGRNVLVAYMPWNGYNFEDAIVISEKTVKEDTFTSIHISEFEVQARDTKLGPEEITRDIPNAGDEALKNLDHDGVIRIGAEVKPGDILVGKITPKSETELAPEERLLRAIFGEKAREVRDTSLRVPHGEYGTIVDVKVFTRDNCDELSPGVNKVVRCYIAQKRKISVGDKMAGRHGNKGVVSRILPMEEMPFLPDGTPLDIVLNPLGVPSRMNIGQVLEVHLGMAANALGWKIMTPVFDGAHEADIRECFRMAGMSEDGKFRLRDGRTGEYFDNPVTVGYMYYLKLHHLVDDKIHARSTGPYALVTQQPLGGKAQFGGQRFGEMEVWALEAYGAAYTLQEILTVKSDDVVGRVKTYEAIVKGQNVPKPGIPESFRVLIKELQALGLDIKVLDKDNEEIDLRQSFDDDDDVGLTPGDQVFDEENVATDGDFDGYSIENEDGEEDDFFSTGDDDEFEGSDNDLFDGIDDEF